MGSAMGSGVGSAVLKRFADITEILRCRANFVLSIKEISEVIIFDQIVCQRNKAFEEKAVITYTCTRVNEKNDSTVRD